MRPTQKIHPKKSPRCEAPPGARSVKAPHQACRSSWPHPQGVSIRRSIDEAILYYERQRTGVGEALLSEIDQAVMRAAAHPEHFPVVFDNIRRALAKRFPYTVFSGYAARRWWGWWSCTAAVIRRFGSGGPEHHAGSRSWCRRKSSRITSHSDFEPIKSKYALDV